MFSMSFFFGNFAASFDQLRLVDLGINIKIST